MTKPALGSRPLYRQVFDHLVDKIATGQLKGADALPSEQALALELGVSQGTVRKALDAMAAERLIDRRQGKGTYVAQYDEEVALFRFFRLTHKGGHRAVPQPGIESVARREAASDEAAKLKIECGTEVIEIERTRLIDDYPMVHEVIVLPERTFPGLDARAPLPNALYTLYQSDYDIKIVRAEEDVWASLATESERDFLKLPLGSPVLTIARVAYDISGNPVEYRLSRCNTADLSYSVTIR